MKWLTSGIIVLACSGCGGSGYVFELTVTDDCALYQDLRYISVAVTPYLLDDGGNDVAFAESKSSTLNTPAFPNTVTIIPPTETQDLKVSVAGYVNNAKGAHVEVVAAAMHFHVDPSQAGVQQATLPLSLQCLPDASAVVDLIARDLSTVDARLVDAKANDLELPDLELPDLKTPDLETPDLETPDLRLPDLKPIDLGPDAAPKG